MNFDEVLDEFLHKIRFGDFKDGEEAVKYFFESLEKIDDPEDRKRVVKTVATIGRKTNVSQITPINYAINFLEKRALEASTKKESSS